MVVYQTNNKPSSTTASVVLSNNMNNEKQQQQNSHTVVNDVNHEKNQTTTSSSLTKQITPIPEVVGMLLSQIQNDKTLDIPKLRSLAYLLSHDVVHKALDIVHSRRITLVVAEPSNRRYFCVKSERKTQNPYVCFENYCSCFDFSREVLPGRKLFCKHLLAIRFANALQWKDINIRKASDVELGAWLATTLCNE